ncbi:MAG: heavy-metal-associated domain-containing protein [Bacteroidales bacterium]|nr:heavy-metal-associated domain-containing protein [Bacteroidales bacterium]
MSLPDGDDTLYIKNVSSGKGVEIVVNGAFSIDAAAQLEGKPSMKDTEGFRTAAPHYHGGENMAMEEDKSETILHSSYHVSGNCDMCRDRIENAAKSVRGVISAGCSVESKMFQVTIDVSLTDEIAIRKAIAGAGHDNEGFRASDSVNVKLPACCLYRD